MIPNQIGSNPNAIKEGATIGIITKIISKKSRKKISYQKKYLRILLNLEKMLCFGLIFQKKTI